jgi:hypothetical protein
MNTAIIGLIATIIGAIIGSLVNESYKRHCDGVATAAAIAGELGSYRVAFGLLDDSIPIMIELAQKGEKLPLPKQDTPSDAVFDAYVDKIGLLGTELAENVALVYGYIRGFRAGFFPLTGNMSLDPTYVVGALTAVHSFLKLANENGEPLIEKLQARAKQPFALWKPFLFLHRIWAQRGQ